MKRRLTAAVPAMMPVLVGYFPKRTAVPDGWSAARNVTDLCSVSACLAPAPPGWIDHWLHNELGFFDSPATARSVARGDGSFTLFAYQLLPARFERGRAAALIIPAVTPEPLTGSFESVGYDVVSKSISAYFECSPLSCCNLAGEIDVNRFCLLESQEEAEAFAERVSEDEPEPGPYYVVEVFRERPRH